MSIVPAGRLSSTSSSRLFQLPFTWRRCPSSPSGSCRPLHRPAPFVCSPVFHLVSMSIISAGLLSATASSRSFHKCFTWRRCPASPSVSSRPLHRPAHVTSLSLAVYTLQLATGWLRYKWGVRLWPGPPCRFAQTLWPYQPVRCLRNKRPSHSQPRL